MNKKLLSLAVAAGIAGASSTAVAVDFTAAAPDAATIATEQTIGASGNIINGALVVAQFAAGFSIDDTNVSYVRFDIAGGTFAAQQVDTGAEITTSNAGGITHTISAGGATTDSYVIYQVVGTANDIGPTDTVSFTPTTGIVTSGTAVTITYALFETGSDAVNNTNALATDNGTLIDFAAANNTAADSVTTPQINVTTTTGTGAVFVGGNPALIGAVNTTDTAGVFTNATGVAANTAAVEASANLTVTGDFTFTQDLVLGAPNGTYATAVVYANTNSDCTSGATTAASSVTATTAIIPIAGAGVNYICANGNGVSLIAEQTFTASYDSDGAAGYNDESTALTLGTLTKNGATDTQDLVLTPNGAFKNFLRVVNTSNLSGDVSFQLTADDGTTVNGVSLADIAGQSSAALAGQNSTSLININDLYAAAQAADATFDAAGGKLRVTVTGNFATILLQNVTVSTDNTTFATF